MARTKLTKIDEVLELVSRDYKRHGLRSIDAVEIHKRRLFPFWGHRAADLVKTQHVEEYIDARQNEGASNATINREVAVLKRGFNLALRSDLIKHKPWFPRLPEADPRSDFFEYDEFRKVEAALRAKGKRANYDGDVVADILVFGYFSGWRLNEVLQLNAEWIKTDLRIAVLPASKHKNKREKVFPLEGEIWGLVGSRLGGINKDGLLFHRNGKPIVSVRKIISSTCNDLGLGVKRFHALRRSLVTNLNRANVAIETGKRISGHTTDSVYRNYNQVTLDQLREAVRKVNSHLGVNHTANHTDKCFQKKMSERALTSVSKYETNGVVNDRKQLTSEQVDEKRFKSPGVVGGEGGIRTLETRKSLPDFESNSLNQPTVSSSLFSSIKKVITKLFDREEKDNGTRGS